MRSGAGGDLDLADLFGDLLGGDLGGGFGGGTAPPTAEELDLLRAQAEQIRADIAAMPEGQAREREAAYLRALELRLSAELGRGELDVSRERLSFDRESLAENIALERERLAQEGRFTERELDLREQEMAQQLGISQQEIKVAKDRLALDRALGIGQLELGRGQLALGQRAQAFEEQQAVAEARANPRRFLETLFLQAGQQPTEAASRLQGVVGFAHGGTVMAEHGKHTVTITKKGKRPITFERGGLHRSLDVPLDEPIPAAKREAALAGRYGPKAKKQAVLAFKGALAAGRRVRRAADGFASGFQFGPSRRVRGPVGDRLTSPNLPFVGATRNWSTGVPFFDQPGFVSTTGFGTLGPRLTAAERTAATTQALGGISPGSAVGRIAMTAPGFAAFSTAFQNYLAERGIPGSEPPVSVGAPPEEVATIRANIAARRRAFLDFLRERYPVEGRRTLEKFAKHGRLGDVLRPSQDIERDAEGGIVTMRRGGVVRGGLLRHLQRAAAGKA